MQFSAIVQFWFIFQSCTELFTISHPHLNSLIYSIWICYVSSASLFPPFLLLFSSQLFLVFHRGSPHSPQEVWDLSYTNVPFLDTDKYNKATLVPASLHNTASTENPKIHHKVHRALHGGSFQGPNHLGACFSLQSDSFFHKVTAWVFISYYFWIYIFIVWKNPSN